jgi:NTP pyrophosphatase (non-canonical NTP hydrolase)
MASITANEYQTGAGRTAMYPGKGELGGLLYTALGLAGEAGEFCNKTKKILRDKGGVIDGPTRLALSEELGDVAWYLAQCANEIGFTLADVMEANLDKLARRAERGVITGSGDSR